MLSNNRLRQRSYGAAALLLFIGTALTAPNDGWTLRFPLPDYPWHALAGSLGDYFAVGGSGAMITTPDGKTWTLRNSGTTENLLAAASNGAVRIAVGEQGTIVSSPDGVTWTKQQSGTTRHLYSIVWNGRGFWAVGEGGTVVSSVDGITWVAKYSGFPQNLRGLVWTGERFIAVGDSGLIFSSQDGAAWVAKHSGATTGLLNAAWTGNKLIAVGYSGGIVMSSDLDSWVAKKLPVLANWTNVIAAGGRLVIIGDNGFTATSSDGEIWETHQAGLFQFNAIGYIDSQFVLLGEDGYICATTDFKSFSEISSHGSTLRTLNDMVFTGKRFVAVGEYGTIMQSEDGGSWALCDSITTEGIYSVAWSGKNLVAGAQSCVLTSNDGIAWKKIPMGSNSISRVVWTGKEFYALQGGIKVLSSPEGEEWTPKSELVGYFKGIAWTGRQFLAYGFGGTLQTSLDGAIWTQQNSGTTAVLNNACGRGDQTVVVGNAGTVLSSSDCVSWNPCVVNLTRSESFSGLFQSNGTFYAVGSDVIASTDGISWTSLGRGSSDTYLCMAASDTRLVIGGAGCRIMSREFSAATLPRPSSQGPSAPLIRQRSGNAVMIEGLGRGRPVVVTLWTPDGRKAASHRITSAADDAVFIPDVAKGIYFLRITRGASIISSAPFLRMK